MKHSLRVQIAEVEREIKKRREVYPRLVTIRKLRQGEADELIAIMQTVLQTLKAVAACPNCGGAERNIDR